MKEEFYSEAVLRAVNEISRDFHVLWNKNADLLKKAGMEHSGFFLAEELTRHLADRMWLERREAQGLLKKRRAKRVKKAESVQSSGG
ncbi:MAG: hypothetical protein FWE85_00340 [Clostridiales bacterium]|nr:hypothetical protein [Clostridiales bacterium]